MSLDRRERLNTFKTQVLWKSGNVAVDPSGNMTFISVFDADNTELINSSGQRSSTGTYYYYISTNANDPLGLYRIRWKGLFDYDSPFEYSPKYDTEIVQIVKVLQD